ncbi:predicted protein [Naegleria gruberi]|uniref:Predicted protein n=1 Tax=Naegleria gruberi TaxID=5762 RepID=D2VN55_NAEGR|nr:uncharacterized protein NAEGRDRAFT_70376 [Naegleria gruberi]EFC41592.1 predicted protein [Naegleria gruberi]|eukprot:XP_002674336.1 predicted protein [Naegleria gruberi strain NEG-M]
MQQKKSLITVVNEEETANCVAEEQAKQTIINVDEGQTSSVNENERSTSSSGNVDNPIIEEVSSSTNHQEEDHSNIENDSEQQTSEHKCSLQPLLDKIRKELISTSSDENSYNVNNVWHYVEEIAYALKKESETQEVYAISSLKIAVELIVVWGIIPRLLKGVGVSVVKRVESMSQQTKVSINKQSELAEDEKKTGAELTKLVKCIRILYEISQWDDFYRGLVLQNYLPDIYASLFQVLFLCTSLKKTLEQKYSSNLAEKYGLDEKDRLFCSELLFKLLNETHESMVVHSLILLMSQSATPQWLKTRCTTWLSKTIQRPKGVFGIISVLLDNVPESSFRSYDKVVDLIITVPKEMETVTYFGIICPQILKLFHLRGRNSSHILRSSALLCGRIIEKYPEIAKKLLLEPVLSPLRKFVDLQKSLDKKFEEDKIKSDSDKSLLFLEDELPSNYKEELLCNENDLGQCVEDIHRLLFGNSPNSVIFNSITPVIPALFQLYCFVSKTKLNLKSACEEIMTSYFKLSDDALAVTKRLLIFDRKLTTKSFLIFAPGESGGVCMKRVSETKRDYLWEATCMINLFKLMKNHTVAGDLFVHLISQYSAMRQHMSELTLKELEQNPENPIIYEQYIPENSIILLQVIQLLITEMGSSIMKNTSQAIAFVKFLLLNNENNQSEDALESVVMALGILSAILCGGISVNTIQDEEKLEDLKPILNRYKSHEQQQISEMASTALLSIDTKQYREVHGNIEEISEDEKIKMKFDQILQDLRDPLLPIRAHGVISLKDLVLEQKKNAIIQKQLQNIFHILQAQLKDEDTYVYYGAIAGLSALGDVYPDEIIPILTDTYQDKKQQVEQRLKIGESLLEIAERCGQLLPKYAHFFVYCFLNSGKETSQDLELVRASSLSNMATLVQILKFGVHPFLQDIMDCASYILKFDSSEQVRRAAVFIYHSFTKTFKTDLSEILDGKNLNHFKQSLERSAFYDKDEIVRINAKSVLSEVDDNDTELLTPQTYIPEASKGHFLNTFLKFTNN